MPSRSIRARLLIGIVFALAVILGTTAWWSYEVTKHESEELFSARLATSARVLDALIARQVEHATIRSPLVISLPAERAADDRGAALGHPYETKIAFQIWHNDGTLLVRSTSASPKPFSSNVAGFSKQIVNGELSHVFVLQSGDTWIQVAEENEVRDELIHDLGIAVMTPLICGAILLLVVVNFLVMYGLAPLRQLATNIQKRRPDSLGALELSEVPEEVLPVVRALNDLLRRVELAFEHERRFTDAAAHELRTPIAALKIHADNVARTEDDTERAESMRKLLRGLDRVTNLAAQMLAYSRAQSVNDVEEKSVIDLPEVLRDASASLEPMRQAKSQAIRFVEAPDARELRILGEASKIQRLVINLLDNASRYSPDHSTIEAMLRTEGATVVLSVANPGPIIRSELRDRVFEPYFRVPGSGSEGSGLGLAIVKQIAIQHGATVELSSITERDGTRVTVRFPALGASAVRT